MIICWNWCISIQSLLYYFWTACSSIHSSTLSSVTRQSIWRLWVINHFKLAVADVDALDSFLSDFCHRIPMSAIFLCFGPSDIHHMARSNRSGSPNKSTRATDSQSQTATRVTRSQITRLQAAGVAVEQQQLQDPEPVTINWLFFDKPRPPECFTIEIPHRLFNRPSQNCRKLFVQELQNEHRFEAHHYSLKFWKVSRHFYSNVHFLKKCSLKIRFLLIPLTKPSGQKPLRTHKRSPRWFNALKSSPSVERSVERSDRHHDASQLSLSAPPRCRTLCCTQRAWHTQRTANGQWLFFLSSFPQSQLSCSSSLDINTSLIR